MVKASRTLDITTSIHTNLLATYQAFWGLPSHEWCSFNNEYTLYRHFTDKHQKLRNIVIFDLETVHYGLRAALLFISLLSQTRLINVLMVGNRDALHFEKSSLDQEMLVPVLPISESFGKVSFNFASLQTFEKRSTLYDVTEEDVALYPVMLHQPYALQWFPGFLSNPDFMQTHRTKFPKS
jgi:hypothetical protein